MNRGELRTAVRRVLLDNSPTYPLLDSNDINAALIQSAYFVQNALAKVNAVPFTRVQLANLVANRDDYPLPSSICSPGVRRVYTLQNGVYIKAKYRSFEKWDDLATERAISGTTTTTDIQYTVEGDYILLYPTPTAALTNGLKIRFASVVTMTDDNSIPQLPLTTHDAIWAHAAAKLGIGLDDTTIKDLTSLADSIITTHNEAYRHRFGNEPEQIEDVGGLDKQSWKTGLNPERGRRY